MHEKAAGYTTSEANKRASFGTRVYESRLTTDKETTPPPTSRPNGYNGGVA